MLFQGSQQGNHLIGGFPDEANTHAASEGFQSDITRVGYQLYPFAHSMALSWSPAFDAHNQTLTLNLHTSNPPEHAPDSCWEFPLGSN